MKCSWCGKPADRMLIVEPAVTRKAKDKETNTIREVVVSFERLAPACAEHGTPALTEAKAKRDRERRGGRDWARRQERLG